MRCVRCVYVVCVLCVWCVCEVCVWCVRRPCQMGGGVAWEGQRGRGRLWRSPKQNSCKVFVNSETRGPPGIHWLGILIIC